MAPKKPETIVVDAYYLTYQGGGSNKFYEVLISDDGTCVLHWGRIGTSGQSSVTTMPTYDEAHDLGMRQVYAKKSKGYSQQSASKFVVEREHLRWAKDGNPAHLFLEVNNARRDGQYSGVKDAVLTHYTDLAEKAQALMNRAERGDLVEVSDEYEALEQAWEAIQDKHAEIEVAMSLAKATFTKRLLGI